MHCMIFITENKFCSYVAFDESLFEFVKKKFKVEHELAYLHVLVTNIDILKRKNISQESIFCSHILRKEIRLVED